MKLAVMTYSMEEAGWDFSGKGIPELCQFTREQGIDGIDWCSVYGADPKEVRKTMDDYGLKTVCYTKSADLNFPEHCDRLPGLETIKETLETAATLGSDKIMVPITGKAGLSASESRSNNIKGLAEAIEIARSFGIILTIEHMHGLHSPFVTSVDINEATKALPDLKITFDSGNCLTGGELSSEAFRKSKDAIVHVHFKDWVVAPDCVGYNGSDGRFYTPVLIGEGIVDHQSVLREMLANGYQGYINIEYQAQIYSSKDAVIKAKDYITGLLDKISTNI